MPIALLSTIANKVKRWNQKLSKHSKRLTENNLLNPYILKTMFSVSPFPSLALAFCLVDYSFYF